MPLGPDQTAKMKNDMMLQLGKPYLWGAKPDPRNPTPDSFDCSGFVYWCYGRQGIIVPQGSEEQHEVSVHVDNPVVGDLAFFVHHSANVSHHVGMLYDDSTVIEARGDPYQRVITRPRKIWEAWHEFVGWQRFKSLA